MQRLKRGVVLMAMLALAAIAVAACGSSSSSSTSNPSGAPSSNSAAGATNASSLQTSAAAAAGSCGSVPTQAPSDPDGALAGLPQSVHAAYNLYNEPVRASAWAHWKPSGPGPYTIYFNAASAEAAPVVAELKNLAAGSKVIKTIVVQDNGFNAQTQTQQLQQAINNKATLIIAYLLNPTADASVVAAAGKAGIPIIVPLSASSSPYMVGLNGNEPLQGAELMSGLASVIGGKGSLVEVQGVPGTDANDGVLAGAATVLKHCPNINVVGKPVGQFAPAPAKTATLEFLAAHPQPVTAAFQVGGMATGIIQAFQQAGRPVASIGDLGATPGALAYWNEHKGSYKGVALAAPLFTGVTIATFDLAQGMLQGRGLKVNEVLQTPILITNSNLGQWVEPGWTLNTALPYASGPSNVFYPPSYLNSFFNKSAS